MREIAFVGNAPVETDIADRVDGADRVVRFNKARGFGGPTGRRVDDLFLVNVGGQMREWLDDPAFWQAAPVAAARRVTLPVACHDPGSGLALAARAGPGSDDGINYENDVRRRLRGRPGLVRTLPEWVRLAAIRALAATGPVPSRPIWPSTGFLALYWYDLAEPDDVRLSVHGYGFSGWPGHPWDRERAWVLRRARAGRLRLHDPAAAGRASDAA